LLVSSGELEERFSSLSLALNSGASNTDRISKLKEIFKDDENAIQSLLEKLQIAPEKFNNLKNTINSLNETNFDKRAEAIQRQLDGIADIIANKVNGNA